MTADQFPSHWKVLPLSEAVDALIDYRGKTPKKTDHGVPLVTAKIVKGGTILPAKEFIAEEDYDSWMVRGLPQAGDIVVTTEAPLGEVAQLANENVALAQRIVTLRGAEGLLLNDYLRYVMQGTYVQGQLESRASGSTVKGIKQSELRKVLLPIPPQHEQRDIATQLKSIDDKVQLNKQINQSLEQMAQAIFKSWFVDFEPVKAKIAALEAGGSEDDTLLAAMQAISGKAPEDLTRLQAEQPQQYAELRATAELFPSAMQDSELGEIPEGWHPVQVEHFIELSYGKALKKTVRVDGPYPVYGSGGITGSHNNPLVSGPGIIVGRKGTVGSIYWETKDFYPIDTAYYVSPKNGGSLSFSYYLLQTLGLKDMNTDAAVPGLNRNNVYRLKIPSYPIPTIERFTQIADSISRKTSASNAEIELLIELRDNLLPKLLSGELNITDEPTEAEA